MTVEVKIKLKRGAFSLDLDTQFPASGVTALFGRSGSGKTTILRCLAGLERIAGARIVVNGIAWQENNDFVPVHKRPLGYVFQESSLFAHMTVKTNLLYGYQRLAEVNKKVNWDETIELMALTPLLAFYPDQLSGGQRQRVALARALLVSPQLLLMDEPLASLDDMSKQEIMPYLERLQAELRIPVIYVSHAIAEVTRLAEHMVLLEQGSVLAQGALQDLLTRHDLPLAYSEQASCVLQTQVRAHDEKYHLSQLSCSGGVLWVSKVQKAPGEKQRVRILARDVAISLEAPQQSSVSNCLEAEVLRITADKNLSHVLVLLTCGEDLLMARITLRSCERLQLTSGKKVMALIKSVSLG